MIPLSLPNLAGKEWEYVKECLDTGWISTAGGFVDRFEVEFAKYLEVDGAVSVVNGTAALHIALQLLGVESNDLVIMPNVTFVASANAISYLGADPILIDIDQNTWQMDLDLLERFLSTDCQLDNTKTLVHTKTSRKISALMIVHVQGNICDMDRLLAICNDYNLPVLEDAAEALGAKYKTQYAGTLGDIGCYSFNGNKIMSTGGGGMIVSNDSVLLKRAKHLTTTAKIDALTYFHDEVGYNYRLVNILAALGLAQLEQLDTFLTSKMNTATYYRDNLKNIGDIGFQLIQNEVESNEWLFTITTASMQQLLDYLNANGVMSRPFWTPMNQLPMYNNNLYINHSDVSAGVHRTALSIPCSTNILGSDLEKVVFTIKMFFER
ncbi:LegC family aminotransferase [Amylibacter sp.]|jgi:perosamine synthetase|nr:LegC family aminotransferase [Amylibacter sp.]